MNHHIELGTLIASVLKNFHPSEQHPFPPSNWIGSEPSRSGIIILSECTKLEPEGDFNFNPIASNHIKAIYGQLGIPHDNIWYIDRSEMTVCFGLPHARGSKYGRTLEIFIECEAIKIVDPKDLLLYTHLTYKKKRFFDLLEAVCKS
jgi:hypothetical protein